MKIFECGNCQYVLFFENNSCENCGHICGYHAQSNQMLTFDLEKNELYSDRKNINFKFCKNKEHKACNWLIPVDDPADFCPACELNRTIPNLSEPENLENWRHLEVAKHRLIYQLQKLQLPLLSKHQTETGLAFDFVVRQNQNDLMTGHANGVVTILLREADSVFREKTRRELSEPYRTLIGHFRHEVGHYFWDILISTHQIYLREFRALFGDERQNYGQSLQQYYNKVESIDWQDSYISHYASSHPWEDWAETWAHYLHIMDMVETAYYFGIRTKHKSNNHQMELSAPLDPYKAPYFDSVLDNFTPLTFAVNSINRSMGIPDVYPFVVSKGVATKMKFIHQVLIANRKRDE